MKEDITIMETKLTRNSLMNSDPTIIEIFWMHHMHEKGHLNIFQRYDVLRETSNIARISPLPPQCCRR